MIDFKNPYWLRSIGGVIPVALARPRVEADAGEEAEFDHLMTGLKDAVHSVVNNTCRACGLDMGGADSEQTWEWCKALGEKVEEFIAEEWKRQDDARKHAEARLRQDEAQLGALVMSINQRRLSLGQPQYRLTKETSDERPSAADPGAPEGAG